MKGEGVVALVAAEGVRDFYRLLAGAIGIAAVAFQYWFYVRGQSGAVLLSDTVNFFSYFTILINLLAAAAMLVPVASPKSSAGKFLSRAPVRTAIAGYIIVVGTVYYFLLSGIGNAEGWPMRLEYVLHYVTPPLFVLDWLLFVPKGRVPWRNGAICLGFPAVYAGWILAHGAMSGWYPYPFLDVADLGYPRVFMNIAGLVLAFLALDLFLTTIDRALGRAPAAPTS
jgi:hypothetical protein